MLLNIDFYTDNISTAKTSLRGSVKSRSQDSRWLSLFVPTFRHVVDHVAACLCPLMTTSIVEATLVVSRPASRVHGRSSVWQTTPQCPSICLFATWPFPHEGADYAALCHQTTLVGCLVICSHDRRTLKSLVFRMNVCPFTLAHIFSNLSQPD